MGHSMGKKSREGLNINVQTAPAVDAHGIPAVDANGVAIHYIKGCQLATKSFEDVAACRYLGDASGVDLCNDLIRLDPNPVNFENIETEKITIGASGSKTLSAVDSNEITIKKIVYAVTNNGNQLQYTNLFLEGPLSDPNDPNSERLPIVVEGKSDGGIDADLVTASEIDVKKICFFKKDNAGDITDSLCREVAPRSRWIDGSIGQECHIDWTRLHFDFRPSEYMYGVDADGKFLCRPW